MLSSQSFKDETGVKQFGVGVIPEMFAHENTRTFCCYSRHGDSVIWNAALASDLNGHTGGNFLLSSHICP